MSTRPKQGKAKSSSSSSPTSKKTSQRSLRPIRSTIDEYILDHRSQNHSYKTIEWHTLALGNLADFLEKQEITCVEQIERVHILSWLNALSNEPGAKGRMLSARTVNCYARSMRAFCRWLEAEGYVEAAPSNRVKMPKVGKPLIAKMLRGVQLIGMSSLCMEASEKVAMLAIGTQKSQVWL